MLRSTNLIELFIWGISELFRTLIVGYRKSGLFIISVQNNTVCRGKLYNALKYAVVSTMIQVVIIF